MIELLSPVKHKLANLGVLSQKNRKPDENPGAQITLEALLPLDVAEMMFPGVRERLFEAVPKPQGQLEGMSLEQVREFTAQCGFIVWEKEHTGHKVTIDFGLGGASNPVIADCKLHHFKFKPEEGSIFCRYKVDSSDVSESMFGRLAKLKSCEVMLTIEPPIIDQSDIEDDAKPSKPRKPGAAERAAVAASNVSPFPKSGSDDSTPPPQSVPVENIGPERSQPGTRTARGRDATTKFIAANTPSSTV